MADRFYDLEFEMMKDGVICLTQQWGVDEPNVIHLHQEQVLFIARRLCGMKPETAGKVAELERRIAVLTDKLQNFVCNKAFRGDLIEGIGEGFEYLAKLDGLLDLALEMDGGRLEPEYNDAELGGCDRKSGAKSPVFPQEAVPKTGPLAEQITASIVDQLELLP